MRKLPSYISQRLNQNIQIWSNKTDINSKIWVSRPSTVLLDERLLERQTVANAPITDVSIAVCHPRARRMNTDIYVAYISNGIARVATAKHKIKMDAHTWFDTGFSQNATAVSIAFDGTMPRSYGSEVEFVTEYDPWIFWVNNTVLYGRQLSSTESPIVLAETNCTDVSAVRAMWSNVGGFDFGLVVFFILEGKLYYRQLIDGEWMDAELVSYGPSGVTWEEVATFRTWDYRIGVQVKATDGKIYELYTQFMGVGKQNTEHIELSDIRTEPKMTSIKYHNTQETEHIDLDDIASVAPYGGLYSTDIPIIVSAYNEESDDGDWGKIIIAEFNVHMNAISISQNPESFTIVDSNGAVYMPSSASLDITTGRIVTLEFTDFNAAKGDCRLEYSPGTIVSMANIDMLETSVSFIPENLNPPIIDPPVPISAINTNSDGTSVAILFTEKIVGDISDNEDKFIVSFDEYDMTPDGTARNVIRTVTNVSQSYISIDQDIDLQSGNFDGVNILDDVLSLEEIT